MVMIKTVILILMAAHGVMVNSGKVISTGRRR